ncbi:two-component regulator propeller domain-containing protein, partial [Streptomyces scabiei]|uniref:two-component regulator propeller domain-containing protein n=1 Tax=Streptomyces scabiei TaxID=1930 RepID=UPI0038F6348A
MTNNTTHIIKIDHQGNLWIGTAYGLEYYNVASGKFTHYHAQAGNANSLSYNTIYALLEDRHNNIWIGTGGG